MQDRLRDVGRWLAVNGEAIYGTVRIVHWGVEIQSVLTMVFSQTPFPLLPELVDEKSGLDLRFTRTAEAFYIIALRLPVSPILRVPAQLPVLKGDRITLLGSRHGESLAWTYDGHRVLEIAIPPPARAKHQPAYVFRVALSF
jgi:alpha-L-fucosidase